MKATLIDPNYVLSDEKKTKVCMITDINKANKLLLGRNIDTQEFDMLYDSDVHTLSEVLRRVGEAIRFRMNVINIARELFEISEAAKQYRERRRYEEDGN